MASKPILMEYLLRSFLPLPWSVPISLDVAARGDVVQERAHTVFTISKISFCTKPTVISSFSTSAAFQLKPTMCAWASFIALKNMYGSRHTFWTVQLTFKTLLCSRRKVKTFRFINLKVGLTTLLCDPPRLAPHLGLYRLCYLCF